MKNLRPLGLAAHRLGVLTGIFLLTSQALALPLKKTSPPAFLASVENATMGRSVQIANNQLVVDGVAQPQLFGAEIQYFRLRGGYGPNQPRAKVIALWNKALDRAVEAGMNAVSFYIPWDFHEYAEGKFDFTGTVDADGDGNPDYPARDVVTFFKLVEQHGIHRIMVRPGPYINAEWGYLGFGAIPSWFSDKFPNTHMISPDGLRTKPFDYASPTLLKYTKRWFTALNDQVLQAQMGPGRPVIFLQLDNETNYQWQSLYAADYSPSSVLRYQTFLQQNYATIDDLNKSHHRSWKDWSEIQAPVVAPGQLSVNLAESGDWYRFADATIGNYLHEIRKIWESLGVTEPSIIFTEAESYNAPENGLLPNFALKNQPGVTGLMTVNLYPKTFETNDHTLMNTPFKADLDTKAVDSANDFYLGSHQEWAMGPEIQGGWWRGIDVTDASRQQTYLTVLGHGMKSFFVYYFNEGDNFGEEWARGKIRPLFDQLVIEQKQQATPVNQLDESFWNELQKRSDHQILLGFDVRHLVQDDGASEQALYFDAPLDGNADPSRHFALLKRIGQNVIAPHRDFLSRSLEVQDSVAIVKDSTSHAPSPVSSINSLWANSDWTGGLVGYLLNCGINPSILHGELSPESEFLLPKMLTHIDTGLNNSRTLKMLSSASARGQMIVNFLSDQAVQKVKPLVRAYPMGYAPRALFKIKKIGKPDLGSHGIANARTDLTYYLSPDGHLRSGTEPDAHASTLAADGPFFTYSAADIATAGCESILYWGTDVVGYFCPSVKGGKEARGAVAQIGALLFDDYNSSTYSQITDSISRRLFMSALLMESKVDSQVRLSANSQMAVAFARKDPAQKILWITVKAGAKFSQSLQMQVSDSLLTEALAPANFYLVTNLLPVSGQPVTQKLSRQELQGKGFDVELTENGSTVYTVETLH